MVASDPRVPVDQRRCSSGEHTFAVAKRRYVEPADVQLRACVVERHRVRPRLASKDLLASEVRKSLGIFLGSRRGATLVR